MIKFKKSILIKFKELDLSKDFTKINIGTDLVTSKVKKTLLYLQKTFTKALILGHIDPEYHVDVITNAL